MEGSGSGRARSGADIGRQPVRAGAHSLWGLAAPWAGCGGRCWFQGLLQIGEVGDEAVDAGEREDAQDGGTGRDHQPQLAAVGQGRSAAPQALKLPAGRWPRILPVLQARTGPIRGQ